MPTFDDPAELKPKWQERFAFFDAYGAPNSPEFRAALKELPGRQKRLINYSFLGFFFGPFYFFTLGMWRKALVLLAISLGIGVLEAIVVISTGIDIPPAIDLGINIGIAMLSAMTVNYSYYLKHVRNSNGWNPFEGMRIA
ncbi:DUF2628 domain-containing protein [Burkholderia guangdongensis]|uniref:DUF2628 domain-containing protein n=1 Tax=Burkholderia guangdongensis TaxID=1792500 RepID=UPI0015CECA5C|nr:DUF2628 domain-containing protein [Burkholderia guangdongensis]